MSCIKRLKHLDVSASVLGIANQLALGLGAHEQRGVSEERFESLCTTAITHEIILTRRMHALLARYAVVPTAMSRMGAKLCALIVKLEIAVWQCPGKNDNMKKWCAWYDYVGSLLSPINVHCTYILHICSREHSL